MTKDLSGSALLHRLETELAMDQLQVEDVVSLIDYPAYFALSGNPLPENRSQVIEALAAAGLIRYDASTGWAITNLGGILFCRRFEQLPSLGRKALRVIRYRGNSRIETMTEQVGERGYAAGFNGLMRYVMEQIQDGEVIEGGLRTSVKRMPEPALRELVANALIHQDFSVRGAGPMVEIFEDRVEITNPGRPLVPQERFVDSPPRSRNERLAKLTRLLGISEERGSGWDKVATLVEVNQLPAPMIEVTDNATRVVVFSARRLDQLDKSDRVRAVYLHACLRYVSREYVTNTSVRERFGLSDVSANVVAASKLIKAAITAGVISVFDTTAGTRAMRYVPFWAAPDREEA
ncbi:MAG: hypothetical protein LBI33_00980 [Propionibacteriaceae bacterium]|jgi:predicted HTH transcriptional regulator|nr:hypothetical protein [Propionibacteriaceae bacterium]